MFSVNNIAKYKYDVAEFKNIPENFIEFDLFNCLDIFVEFDFCMRKVSFLAKF